MELNTTKSKRENFYLSVLCLPSFFLLLFPSLFVVLCAWRVGDSPLQLRLYRTARHPTQRGKVINTTRLTEEQISVHSFLTHSLQHGTCRHTHAIDGASSAEPPATPRNQQRRPTRTHHRPTHTKQQAHTYATNTETCDAKKKRSARIGALFRVDGANRVDSVVVDHQFLPGDCTAAPTTDLLLLA